MNMQYYYHDIRSEGKNSYVKTSQYIETIVINFIILLGKLILNLSQNLWLSPTFLDSFVWFLKSKDKNFLEKFFFLPYYNIKSQKVVEKSFLRIERLEKMFLIIIITHFFFWRCKEPTPDTSLEPMPMLYSFWFDCKNSGNIPNEQNETTHFTKHLGGCYIFIYPMSIRITIFFVQLTAEFSLFLFFSPGRV